MANECSNSENLFPAYNQHENLQEENQDIQRINLELNEKNQEISRNNLELNKKYYQEISQNNEQKNCNINNNRTTFALNYSKGLDVRVIVGLDFGVTYSGFAYCHVNDDYQDIHTNDIWPMAITDYLREIGVVIKGTIECRWGGIDYFEDVF
ncbi:unnamed protein product [Rhizophagus irregularis]|nr:unnamed protein product [Rhizophagus irregularis]